MIGVLIWLQLSWPIPGKITLTGTYGEIRGGTTLHMGIDLGVGEKIGEVPLLAAADGYVYRIRVSYTGFGKVLYVRHAGGIQTVYGHLSHFASPGEELITAQQQKERKFEAELYLPPTAWQVKRGDTLGWAGNSGYSFGPHLHFEVRTYNDEPLPPFAYLPSLSDAEPPVFFRLALMPLGYASHVNGQGNLVLLPLRVRKSSSTFREYEVPETLSVWGRMGFSCSVGDRTGGGMAWNGVRRLRLKTPEKLLYELHWDTLNFDWQRYLRWQVDYAFQQVYPGLLLRLYEPPDHLQPWSQGSGVLHFSLPKIETYFIEAEDFAGNQSRVRVTLRTHSSSDTKYLPLGRSWTWSIEQGQLRVSKTLRTRQGEVLHPTQPLALNGKLPDTLFSPEGKGIPTWLRACIVPGFSQKVGLSVGCTLTLAPECLRETLYCRVEPIETPWGNGFLVGDPLIPLKSSAQLRWELPLTSPHLPKTYPIYR
ncbi:MAG: M23 family metallopeptidase, partial [Bacteroidia bacterium]|nr:M23 family metallopeptidase [Bacteroidia bacterium]